MQGSLFEIFVFLTASCIVVPLAARIKLGSVLGYLLAGIIIGPFVLGFITDAKKVMDFAEFGVVMMLFVIGLELEPAMLWRMRKSIIGLGGLQVVITSAAFTTLGVTTGYSWQVSLSVGMALALSSTALVLQMLKEKNLMNTLVGETAFSILLFQDIAVIPILVLMPLLASADMTGANAHHTIISHLNGYAQAAIVTLVIILVILGGRYLSHHMFRIVARTKLQEIFTALSLALVVGITLLMEMVGVSPALGAFVAGVALANSEYRRKLETDIEPFKGLLLGLFFISIGMGIDFSMLFEVPLSVFAAVAMLMVVKAAILWALGGSLDMGIRYNIGYALALSQGGEFAFVLFQFAGGLSILSAEQVKFLTLVVAISIAVTPLVMIWYNRAIVPRFMSVLPEREYDPIDEKNSIILAGYGRFGQIIGRFLTGQGLKVTIMEKNPDQIELLRKFGFKGYYGDAARADLLRAAGAQNSRLLIVAVDDVADSLDIVRVAKEEFPNLTIFARARNRQHAYDLNKLGVYYFKRELFDSSLNMAKDIMLWLGKPETDINLKAEQFKKHDEDSLRESFQFYEDEAALVDYAKARREELERILQSDNSDKHKLKIVKG